VNAILCGLATLILTTVVLQMAACTTYIPPKSGLTSRQNWLEGGGG
jgi:hypothetical protein